MSLAELLHDLAADPVRLVLIGETHDVPQAHEFERKKVDAHLALTKVTQRRPCALSLEMLKRATNDDER